MTITSTKDLTFGYYVNLDERGCFDADVRNMDGTTMLEIKSGEEGEIELLVDGFIKHKHDLDGIAEYAQSIGALPAGSTVLKMADFEQFEQEWADAVAVLAEFDPAATITELYEDNDDLADALDDLISDFKLQDYGSLTVAAISAHLTGQAEPEPKKSVGMRLG